MQEGHGELSSDVSFIPFAPGALWHNSSGLQAVLSATQAGNVRL